MSQKLQRIFEIHHFYVFPELVIYTGNPPNPMYPGFAGNFTCIFRRFVDRFGPPQLFGDLTTAKTFIHDVVPAHGLPAVKI